MIEKAHNGLNATSAAPFAAAPGGVLQRKCECGNHTAGGECAACGVRREGTLQRKAVDSAEMTVAPPIVHDVLRSPGRPLQAETRDFMESRFGQDFSGVRVQSAAPHLAPSALTVAPPSDRYEQEAERMATQIMRAPAADAQPAPSPHARYDFSQVRIHTDAKAAESARSVQALAYTVGRDIVFGEGQYAPSTAEGKRVLAHELAHVIQQSNYAPGSRIFRISPKYCTPPARCAQPDEKGAGTPTSWKLTLAVDRESKGLKRLVSGDVGHTWVKLTDNAGTKYSYGFWPEKGFNSKKPWEAVPGCVHHPDTLHEPPAATEYLEVDYPLTDKNFSNALTHAQSVCLKKPMYDLFSYNCTTFAIDVTKAAGASPPPSASLAIDNPNALAQGIEEQKGKKKPDWVTALSIFGGLAGGAAIGALAGGPLGAFIGGAVGLAGGLLGAGIFGDIL
jgi:hypothetical protein